MLIAVGVDENDKITSHLGKTRIFMVFDRRGDKIRFIEMRKTSGEHKNHIIEDIKDCKFVISGQIGEGMIDNLMSIGISPIVETKTDNPIEAVKRLG